MEGLWRRKKRNWMTNRSQSCKDGGKSTASRRNSQCKDPNMGQRWVFSGKRRKTRRPGQCGVRSVRRMQAQITWGAVSPAQERVGILLQARWKSLEGLRKMTLSDVCVCVVFLFLFLRKFFAERIGGDKTWKQRTQLGDFYFCEKQWWFELVVKWRWEGHRFGFG